MLPNRLIETEAGLSLAVGIRQIGIGKVPAHGQIGWPHPKGDQAAIIQIAAAKKFRIQTKTGARRGVQVKVGERKRRRV